MYHGYNDFDNYGEDENHHCHVYLPVVGAAAQGLPTSSMQ